MGSNHSYKIAFYFSHILDTKHGYNFSQLHIFYDQFRRDIYFVIIDDTAYIGH